jgi:hypothetical protein
MINRNKQLGLAPLAIFGIVLSVAVVAGAIYIVTLGGKTDVPSEISDALGVKQETEEDNEYCNQPNVTC